MDDFYIIHSDKDAPHTGARLETHTKNGAHAGGFLMPPTRGHDLKRCCSCSYWRICEMPPTRGHDL